MLIAVSNTLRKIAYSMINAEEYGTPYENISIFMPKDLPPDLGSYGPASLVDKDDDDMSKWKNDMRRLGPNPPAMDVFDREYEPGDTVNSEIPGGVGDVAEGPKTDAQGLRTRNTPDDLDRGIINPNDMNRELYSPAEPDDLGSAI